MATATDVVISDGHKVGPGRGMYTFFQNDKFPVMWFLINMKGPRGTQYNIDCVYHSEAEPEPMKLYASHCLGCGRVYATTVDVDMDTCPVCENELYPVDKLITPGKEIMGGDGTQIRVQE